MPIDDRKASSGLQRVANRACEVLGGARGDYKLVHPTEPFNGIAIIQADKGVEFKALKKVMYSAATAGYNNVNFAVKQRPRAAAAE